MPCALKFTNFAILHPHQPYTFLSPSSATTAESIRLNHPAGWWRRTTAYAPPPHRRINTWIFGGREDCRFYSDSTNGEVDRKLFSDSKNKIGTKMCVTANGKAESQADVSPTQKLTGTSPAQPAKLLTLPTMLTIGRVVAVPLLVGSMYRIFAHSDSRVLFWVNVYDLIMSMFRKHRLYNLIVNCAVWQMIACIIIGYFWIFCYNYLCLKVRAFLFL